MRPEDWTQENRHVLGCLVGRPARERAPILLLFNAEERDVAFPLPGGSWEIVLHTVDAAAHGRWVVGETVFTLPARSVVAMAAAGHALRF